MLKNIIYACIAATLTFEAAAQDPGAAATKAAQANAYHLQRRLDEASAQYRELLNLEPPATPSSIAPGLPASVDLTVEKALAKLPEERFQSAAEMKDALEGILDPKRAGPRKTTSIFRRTMIPAITNWCGFDTIRTA